MRSKLAIVFALLFILSCKVERPIEIESVNFEFIELEKGVYSCIHKFGGKAICNVGIVDNGKETIVFDSFLSPDVAEELLEALNEMNLSPVKYVVNSHFHNDHIRGNQVFSEAVKIISTARTSEIIEEEEPLQIAYEKENAPARLAYYDSLYKSFSGDTKSREYQQILMWKPYYEILSNSHLKVKTRVPDMFVDSIHNIDGPDRRIQLISKGQGHTESDLVLYLPDDDIIFTGDLVFNECHPYVPHGNISKWKAWLDFMNSLNVKTVMPGHGELSTETLITTMKNYLVDLENMAVELHEKDLSDISFDSIPLPVKYKDWWFDRFYSSNLRFAYEIINSNGTE
ncbi:MAG: MBL fold metallo-hydrolase [Bacteroidia bacterium]|nr:MBL fold metallo-hydrolase [Bacteroidia bacterium]MBT8268420.1 MBL fold metallo-hydrolase [Bacteroidia bacterium]NNK69635.1 MBL fold metallo-hydrolase [Flavobacteriaceae bacterium]